MPYRINLLSSVPYILCTWISEIVFHRKIQVTKLKLMLKELTYSSASQVTFYVAYSQEC